MLREPGIPSFVAQWLLADAMAVAVHLDRQALLITVEIQDVRPDRMLPAELQVRPIARADRSPKQRLWQRQASAQFAGAADGERRGVHLERVPGAAKLVTPARTAPPPPLRGPPPPRSLRE